MEGGLRCEGTIKKSLPGKPLVSIITVVYNRSKYLEQAILSVLSQTYKNIEYIIIDGGSTDGTLDVVKRYNYHVSFWMSEKDDGMYYALNKGITLANGEVIGICHSDDYYYSNEIVNHIVEKHQIAKADVYHGDGIYLKEISKESDRNLVVKSDSGLILKTHNSIVHPTTFISKDIFNKFGLYCTKYKSASDYEFMMRLVMNGCKFIHIGEVVTCIRVTNTDRVSNNCYGHLEVYSIHKYHKTGNHNKYLVSYLKCKIRRIIKMLVY